MIGSLRGTVARLDLGEVLIDVHGVGYLVHTPLSVWEELPEKKEVLLWTSTYVREDRLDLFGFTDKATRLLFEELLGHQGIGPKMALEICGVPRSLLTQAMDMNDPSLLTSIKGIGRKTAEKVLIELKALAEKYPHLFATGTGKTAADGNASFDRDAIAALTQLGYTTPDVMEILRGLPKDLKTTEERVTAALRSL